MISKKIVLIGTFGVGKTSLIRRFVEDQFTDDYKVTIGVHIMKKEVEVAQQQVNLIIWDTEGNDDIKEVRSSYLLGTHGFIYVADISRPNTYKVMDTHLNYLEQKFPGVPILKVGNKSDLIPKGQMAEKKKEFAFLDILVSAKEGNNVQRMFEKLAKELV